MEAYAQIVVIVAVGVTVGLCGYAATAAAVSIFNHFVQRVSPHKESESS